MYTLALSLILLCNFVSCQPQNLDSRPSVDQCYSFVEGPFGFCSALGGYNMTFKYPDHLTNLMLRDAAIKFRGFLTFMQNCSQRATAEALLCSFFIPHCSKGERVYPCKRVCGEFLKQCEERLPRRALDYIIAACHILPDAIASSGKCFEPPNFATNDSIKGPLDRGCQQLIIPACKNLGVSNHTLVTVQQQRQWYHYTYKKAPSADLEPDFPPKFLEMLQRYPKCQQNLKKMICGEFFPPCFPDEGHGYYSICQSVCDDIARDCPEFFRNASYLDVEYCALMGKGNTSHGYCKRTDWPPPFSWTRYMIEGQMVAREKPSEETPSKGPKPKHAKVWVIVVVVLVVFIVVGLIFVGAVCLKWRRHPTSGYKKQEDEMMAPLETSVDL